MDFGDLQQLQASFRHEADDLLTDLGGALLLLEQDPHNMDVVNRVFRAMHTLKGSGASAGFRRLANFVHHVEEVFNRIRNQQLQSTPELIDATLKALVNEAIAANYYSLSVSSYVEARDTREVVNMAQLNAELKTTVAKIDKLRVEIDAIVAEIEGEELEG